MRLNARARLERVPESQVASEFLTRKLGIEPDVQADGQASRLWRGTREHLFLVLVSLLGAVVVAVPLGVLAAKRT